MDRVRVYHPETNEPFDVTPSKATHLRLEKGWLSQPFTTVEAPEPDPVDVVVDWRFAGTEGEEPENDGSVDVDQEDEAPAPSGRGRRRKAAED